MAVERGVLFSLHRKVYFKGALEKHKACSCKWRSPQTCRESDSLWLHCFLHFLAPLTPTLAQHMFVGRNMLCAVDPRHGRQFTAVALIQGWVSTDEVVSSC